MQLFHCDTNVDGVYEQLCRDYISLMAIAKACTDKSQNKINCFDIKIKHFSVYELERFLLNCTFTYLQHIGLGHLG